MLPIQIRLKSNKTSVADKKKVTKSMERRAGGKYPVQSIGVDDPSMQGIGCCSPAQMLGFVVYFVKLL